MVFPKENAQTFDEVYGRFKGMGCKGRNFVDQTQGNRNGENVMLLAKADPTFMPAVWGS